MKLSEILKPIKAQESETSIGMVALLHNDRAQRMAAAFCLMSAPVVEIRPTDRMAEIIASDLIEDLDAATILEALWESTQVDFSELCRRSGILQPEHGRRLFLELTANFVIYPDGTLHGRAMEYLQSLTNHKEVNPEAME